MTPGELIEQLILTNIKQWHKDTKLRNNVPLSSKEIVVLGLDVRLINRTRCVLKQDINKIFKDDFFDERKTTYWEKK